MTIDRTYCCISEPGQNTSTKKYSHKTHGPRVTYVIGMAIHHNQIAWINSPFPAGQNDITVFKKPGGLKDKHWKDSFLCHPLTMPCLFSFYFVIQQSLVSFSQGKHIIAD